jgi:hypothetical protein
MASLHGLELTNMQRTYDDEARAFLVQFLQNAIEAVENGLVRDPGDMGAIAKGLEEIAVKFEDGGLLPDDARTWFHQGCGTKELQSVLTQGFERVNTESEVAA